jgi:hypothetical protein
MSPHNDAHTPDADVSVEASPSSAEKRPGSSEHGSSEHGSSEHGSSEHGSSEHGSSEHGSSRLTYVAFFISVTVAIPWYWHLLAPATALKPVAGLPRWTVVSILGSLAVSVATWRLYQKTWDAEISEAESATKEEGKAG